MTKRLLLNDHCENRKNSRIFLMWMVNSTYPDIAWLFRNYLTMLAKESAEGCRMITVMECRLAFRAPI